MQNFYLGGDVSKGYSDFVLIDSSKQVVIENFQLDDTLNGHMKLNDILSDFCDSHPTAAIHAAVESTGGYEDNWHNYLVNLQGTLPVRAARLNPCGVCNNSKAELNRNITDRISAKNIAKYLIEHPDKVVYQQEERLEPLKKQWGFIRLLIKQSTQLQNRLESLVYIANPEILAYCKHETPQWVYKLLKSYPTAKKLSKARPSKVSKIPYITYERAEELIAAAKKSVASANDETTEEIISLTVKEILHKEELIKMQTKRMIKKHPFPEIELLSSFKGIGDTSAIGLLIEIVAVERFETVKHLASFFGLHPVYKKSGDGTGAMRMSKQGRTVPRHILYMVALSALKSNPLIQEVYIKHTDKGKSGKAALGVCMHKILRIIYGMLKNKTKFDPEIDRMNQKKHVSKEVTTVNKKDRRFQEYDSAAPISRRQNKKRMERKVSQNGKTAECGINASAPTPV
jgi:transposase